MHIQLFQKQKASSWKLSSKNGIPPSILFGNCYLSFKNLITESLCDCVSITVLLKKKKNHSCPKAFNLSLSNLLLWAVLILVNVYFILGVVQAQHPGAIILFSYYISNPSVRPVYIQNVDTIKPLIPIAIHHYSPKVNVNIFLIIFPPFHVLIKTDS